MAELACSEQELAQFLNGLSFTRSYGFTLHGAAEGRCSLDVPFREAFERVAELVVELRGAGLPVRRVDLGGGLGIRYHAETPPEPKDALRATVRRK